MSKSGHRKGFVAIVVVLVNEANKTINAMYYVPKILGILCFETLLKTK